ncbi:beta-phosphoglucomutase [Mesoplasma photuris]|uniref:beta-phosphoglucomutase n=1 Tax=Mesoplasma photuris TaxID=217731 RepID=UPI0004E18D10|nr:beta-phosphoglucomutase [Mesoplasma photuris]
MSIKGFIFDLDGVITETAWMHFESWKKMASKINIKLSTEDEKLLRGVSRSESLNLIIKKYSTEDYSLEFKLELEDYKNSEYIKLLENLNENYILPNVLEILKYLKNKNIKIALASVSKNAVMIIKKLGIYEYFDYIVDINKVTNSKPNPEIFEKAIAGLELQKNEVIVVDDSEIGMETVENGNIKSIGIGVKGLYSFPSTKEFGIKELKRILEENKNG